MGLERQQSSQSHNSFASKLNFLTSKIASATALVQRWNDRQSQYLATLQQLRDKAQYSSDIVTLKVPTEKLISMFSALLALSSLKQGKYLLFSSTPITRNLLSISGKDNYLSLQILDQQNGQELTFFEIDYHRKVRIEAEDYWICFWFQIERRLLIIGINTGTRHALRGLFFDTVSNEKANYFSCFLNVRHFLSNQQRLESLLDSYIQLIASKQLAPQAAQQSSNPFKAVIDNFNQFTIRKYRSALSDALEFEPIKTKTVLQAIRHFAQLQFSPPDQKLLTIKENELRLKLNNQDPIDLLSSENFTVLFPFVYLSDQKILQFSWTPYEYVSVFYGSLFQSQLRSFALAHHLVNQKRYFWNMTKVALEHSIVMSIIAGSTLNIFSNSSLSALKFNIAHYKDYFSFNRFYKLKGKDDLTGREFQAIKYYNYKPQILYTAEYVDAAEYFRQIFLECDIRQGQYILGTPVIKILESDILFYDGSDCIDFVIAKSIGPCQYQIFTFEVLVPGNAVASPAEEFFTKLHNYDENLLYQIIHIKLCPPSDCKEVQVDWSKKVNIIYCSLTDIEFLNVQNSLTHRVFIDQRAEAMIVDK